MKKLIAVSSLFLFLILFGVTIGSPVFNHAVHLEQDLACEQCHVPAGGPDREAEMPDHGLCLDCHDEDEIPVPAPFPFSHFGDYRYEHQFDSRAGDGDCAQCHRNEEKCALCHHGENIDFLSHDRNRRYFHAIDSYKGIEDCSTCHETGSFCQGCHLENGVKPGSHLVSGWTSPGMHGAEAKIDLVGCISCHGGQEPVCKDCHGE